MVAESSPQAATALALFEGHGGEREDDAARFYLGRPLDLPLSLAADGPTVAGPDAGGAVVGSFRWFDSVDGQPGFQWVQKTSDRVVLSEGQGPPGAKGPRLYDWAAAKLPANLVFDPDPPTTTGGFWPAAASPTPATSPTTWPTPPPPSVCPNSY